MGDKLRAAAERALDAMNRLHGTITETDWAIDLTSEITELEAALAEAEDEAWETDYEVRVDTGYEEMWVAGADDLKDALHYAPQYTDEGTVRVYERRMKVIASLEANHD